MNAPQAASRRQVISYVADTYGVEPDWPWDGTYTTSCVLRHPGNRKWFGLLMSVRRELLGLDGEEPVDILNVKCDPDVASIARGAEGILPAYHMNKDAWVSILLDGSVPEEMVFDLLDRSFELTAPKARRLKKDVPPTSC